MLADTQSGSLSRPAPTQDQHMHVGLLFLLCSAIWKGPQHFLGFLDLWIGWGFCTWAGLWLKCPVSPAGALGRLALSAGLGSCLPGCLPGRFLRALCSVIPSVDVLGSSPAARPQLQHLW